MTVTGTPKTPTAVIDYRPAGSAGDPSGEALRHAQQALVFFGLLGFAVGCFGGFIGNLVTIPDGQRTLGAVMLLGCTLGYVVLRAINATPCTVSRVALSLTSAAAVFGAAVACAFRFPHRPLDNPTMLVGGLAVMIVGVALFATARSSMRRSATQS